MPQYYVAVDSGTTNTRARLWNGKAIIASASAEVGARNTALAGSNQQLKAAVAKLVAQVQAEAGVAADAVMCTGMASAPGGLLEVPHVPAPARPADLARQMVRAVFPEISPLPFFIIPGVKTVPDQITPANLSTVDVMRGEETEVIGLRQCLNLKGPYVFLHCGSHHKAITVGADGTILGSRTALTGELLRAVAEDTILQESVLPLGSIRPDPVMWKAGLQAALATGTGRALFLVRIVHQTAGWGKEAATSYLLGVLAALDLLLLDEFAPNNCPVVIYGSGHFPQILHEALTGDRWPQVLRIPEEIASVSSVFGAAYIYGVNQEGQMA